MSIAFMSLLSAVISERINLKGGILSLAPLLAAGIGSVLYWHFGEQSGSGDLRPYVLVQFYSLAAIILASITLPSRYTRNRDLLGVAAFYSIAKVLELLDAQIFGLGRMVSGHTLKHIVAGGSAFWILHMLRQRSPAPLAKL
jgi:hypothetical protein